MPGSSVLVQTFTRTFAMPGRHSADGTVRWSTAPPTRSGREMAAEPRSQAAWLPADAQHPQADTRLQRSAKQASSCRPQGQSQDGNMPPGTACSPGASDPHWTRSRTPGPCAGSSSSRTSAGATCATSAGWADRYAERGGDAVIRSPYGQDAVSRSADRAPDPCDPAGRCRPRPG